MADLDQAGPEHEDFDSFVVQLQAEIDEQARAIYSAKVIQLANEPINVGSMDAPTAKGLVTGWCGDTMEFFLRREGDRIAEATFMTDGCGATLACGSMLTTMIHGMSMDEAGEIMPEDLIAALDGLPEDSEHCAVLAVSTLQNAIFNWHGPPATDRSGSSLPSQPAAMPGEV